MPPRKPRQKKWKDLSRDIPELHQERKAGKHTIPLEELLQKVNDRRIFLKREISDNVLDPRDRPITPGMARKYYFQFSPISPKGGAREVTGLFEERRGVRRPLRSEEYNKFLGDRYGRYYTYHFKRLDEAIRRTTTRMKKLQTDLDEASKLSTAKDLIEFNKRLLIYHKMNAKLDRLYHGRMDAAYNFFEKFDAGPFELREHKMDSAVFFLKRNWKNYKNSLKRARMTRAAIELLQKNPKIVLEQMKQHAILEQRWARAHGAFREEEEDAQLAIMHPVNEKEAPKQKERLKKLEIAYIESEIALMTRYHIFSTQYG
ncbi:MAG: hypothetical protein AABX02_00690, partial [archaeon]